MLLKKHKVDVYEGLGALTADGHRHGRRPGARGEQGDRRSPPARCKRPIPGTEFGGRVIGTEEAWALEELPGTLAVVGAGASGTEIASAYVRLGSKVQLFEGLDRVLPVEDADICKVAARGFKKQGIDVHTKTFVTDVESGRVVRHVHVRRGAGRGRLARHRRRPRARRRGPRARRRRA